MLLQRAQPSSSKSRFSARRYLGHEIAIIYLTRYRSISGRETIRFHIPPAFFCHGSSLLPLTSSFWAPTCSIGDIAWAHYTRSSLSTGPMMPAIIDATPDAAPIRQPSFSADTKSRRGMLLPHHVSRPPIRCRRAQGARLACCYFATLLLSRRLQGTRQPRHAGVTAPFLSRLVYQAFHKCRFHYRSALLCVDVTMRLSFPGAFYHDFSCRQPRGRRHRIPSACAMTWLSPWLALRSPGRIIFAHKAFTPRALIYHSPVAHSARDAAR